MKPLSKTTFWGELPNRLKSNFLSISIILVAACLATSCARRERTPPPFASLSLGAFDSGEAYEYYNVYRHTEPINATTFIEAERLAARIPRTQAEFTYEPTASGTVYYLVTRADMFGREQVVFEEPYHVGPLTERDNTAPAGVGFDVTYVDAEDGRIRAAVEWELPASIRNPERIACYEIYRSRTPDIAAGDLLATEEITLLNGITLHQRFVDHTGGSEGGGYYYVLPVDGTGNKPGIDSTLARAAVFDPDLAVNTRDHFLTENRDIATTRMYPLVGQEVQYKVRIHNQGAGKAENVPVTISAPPDGQILFDGVVSVAMNAHTDLPFGWKPQQAGKHTLVVSINRDKGIAESDYTNNELSVNIHVVTRQPYIVWYGNPVNPRYTNVPQLKNISRKGTLSHADWVRVGAIPSWWAGLGYSGGSKATPPPGKSASFDGQGGRHGELIDEINPKMDFKDLRGNNVYASLLRFKTLCNKAGSDPLIAYWTVGSTVHESMLDLLKEGAIDLVMFEKYFTCPKNYDRESDPREITGWRKQLKGIFDRAREGGYIDNILIGISTTQYGTNADKKLQDIYLTFIEEQMYFISTTAPEVPGIALYTAGNDYLAPIIDALCYKYFIEREGH